MPLARLAIPMFLEGILRTTLTSADIFILSFYSQSAVAAVGLVNNFSFFIMILYMVITTGSSVLISQCLGAGREKEAGEAALASFLMASVFSVLLSLAVLLGAHGILAVYRLEPDVLEYAWQYFVITGGCSVFIAFNIAQASVLRSYGHAKDAMWSNMAANLLNVAGNAIAIFGPLGIPKTGVSGVALSTVASQAAACVILAVRIRRLREIRVPWRSFASLPRPLYLRILAVGAPTAGENLSYQVGQIVISWIVSGFGTAAMAANTYAITLLRFVFMPAMSIGNAGQIKTGYLVGAGRFEDARRSVWRYYLTALCLSAVIVLALNLAHAPLISLFTRDAGIAALTSSIFLISFARETGRVSNIVVIPSLKGAGDVVFPVAVGILFMWGVGVGGAFLLGRVLGLGLAGVWIAIAADEWVRGLAMCVRWQSGAWTGKALVKTGDA